LGGAATVDLGLVSWIRAFVRVEDLGDSGTGTGSLRHLQVGPVFEISRDVEAWLLYDYMDSGPDNGAPQQQAYFRLRISV
jgi:hypothetical protein